MVKSNSAGKHSSVEGRRKLLQKEKNPLNRHNFNNFNNLTTLE